MTNQELLELYPFLEVDPEYNYVDDENVLYSEKGLYLPEGWYNLFLDCCAELRQALINCNELNNFKINQLKEKYGKMCIYTNFVNDEISYIIEKYEILSCFTCCVCGKPATVETSSWICPYCDDCIKSVNDKTVPIEYYAMTKFKAGNEYKTYITSYNLPGNPNTSLVINVENGSVTIPKKWLEIEQIKEYIDNNDLSIVQQRDVSNTISRLEKEYGKDR